MLAVDFAAATAGFDSTVLGVSGGRVSPDGFADLEDVEAEFAAVRVSFGGFSSTGCRSLAELELVGLPVPQSWYR